MRPSPNYCEGRPSSDHPAAEAGVGAPPCSGRPRVLGPQAVPRIGSRIPEPIRRNATPAYPQDKEAFRLALAQGGAHLHHRKVCPQNILERSHFCLLPGASWWKFKSTLPLPLSPLPFGDSAHSVTSSMDAKGTDSPSGPTHMATMPSERTVGAAAS